MLPPDPGMIIERGRRCAALLTPGSEFLAVIDDLSNYHMQAIAACPIGPASAPTITHHHVLHTAIKEIAEQVQAFAQAGAELEDAAVDKEFDIDD